MQPAMTRGGTSDTVPRAALQFAVMLMLAGFVAPASAVCTATALGVAFGTYNPLSATPLDSSGQVTVTCTGISLLISYDILLSTGGSGSYAPRKMTVLSNNLDYNLYTASNRATVWGNGTGGTSVITDGYVLSLGTVIRNYPVYGQVPAQQNVATGSYADTIIVTVNY